MDWRRYKGKHGGKKKSAMQILRAVTVWLLPSEQIVHSTSHDMISRRSPSGQKQNGEHNACQFYLPESESSNADERKKYKLILQEY